MRTALHPPTIRTARSAPKGAGVRAAHPRRVERLIRLAAGYALDQIAEAQEATDKRLGRVLRRKPSTINRRRHGAAWSLSQALFEVYLLELHGHSTAPIRTVVDAVAECGRRDHVRALQAAGRVH
jgi:ribonuclease HI